MFLFRLQKVLDEYRTKGDKFLAEVLKSSKYLEELTGMMEAFNVRDDDEVSLIALLVMGSWAYDIVLKVWIKY